MRGGRLAVAHDDALGLDGGDVQLSSNATLAFEGGVTITGENITGADGSAASQSGSIVNLSGDNTFLGNITAAQVSANQELSIASDSGTLTLGQLGVHTIDVEFSALVFDGAGNIVVNSNIVGENVAQEVPGIQAFVFNGNTLREPGDPNQLQSVFTADEIDMNTDADFLALFSVLAEQNKEDNYGSTYLTTLVIPDRLGGNTPYSVEFFNVRSDDANLYWVDLDQDGVFETAGDNGDERIINVGCCPTNTSVNVVLAPGEYAVKLQHREGGGGSDMRPRIDLGDGNGRQIWDPGDMLGGVEFIVEFDPDKRLLKMGTGTVTLAGDNATYEADISIHEGTLIAASDTALGAESFQAQGGLVQLWQVGTDNGSQGAFVQENGHSNAPPGQPGARDEAARMRSAGEDALRQAARDALLRLQESIREELTRHVRKLVAHRLEDPSFLERMILEVARRAMPEDAGKHVEILLPDDAATVEELSRNPESLAEGSLTKFVLGLTGDAIREGLTFKPAGNNSPGIRVQIVEEDVRIDLTDQAISDLLMRHVLLPRLAAVLHKDE